jgi:Family of unknown function (DUF6505)
MALKLLRTIRLDPSDTFVFDQAAEPGEWAVSGSFVFWDYDPEQAPPKTRVAFRSGLLGLESLGWSTLAQVVDADQQQRRAAVEMLASHLLHRFGAPDAEQARGASEDEFAFSQSLCDHPAGTLIAVHRTWEAGEVREAFRTLRPRAGPKLSRAFSFPETDDHEEAADEVRLADLVRTERP